MVTTAQNTDVTTLIEAQHQEVRDLFSRLKGARGSEAEDLFCQLRRLLAVHETAEEEVVYPALKAQGEAARQAAEARQQEEDKAKTALHELEKMGPADPGFAAALSRFHHDVERHAEAEERDVLPRLRSELSSDQLEKMAKLFVVAEKAAPTHPHPHAPQSALGNLVLGPAVAIMDRVRDAIRGQP